MDELQWKQTTDDGNCSGGRQQKVVAAVRGGNRWWKLQVSATGELQLQMAADGGS